MSSDQNANRQRTIFIVVTIILVGIIGFLVINQSQQSKKIDQQVVQLDEAERLQLDLERQYYESLSELEQQRSTNEELNSLIEAQKEELKQQKDQISQLIKTRSDLAAARQQITNLRTQTDTYLSEINDLKAQNEELLASNQELSSQNIQLSENIERERMEKDEILSAKSSLMSEKERLESTNVELSRKVTRASMVPVTNINVQGVQIRSSGKESKKSRAGNIDRLRICFTAGENELTERGYERFYVRIITPQGETIAIETLGSGTFTNSESNERMRYTQIKEIEYDNTKQEGCLNWDQDSFNPGEYKVEVYNKGYLAGMSTFRLR